MEIQKQRKYVIRQFLHEYFDLRRGKEDENQTIESIKNGVEMKGTTLWVLICAIFIASLGLNVNSTAVIIGAMLISPLMGPIMGVGLAVGIEDFELMKRSLKSYVITTLFSIITATIYFTFTPLDEVQSELLARTSPTIYDVFIALVGGIAGIIALATKEKGNVIPGVAIATALMPPLCTAGFGIATGNFFYFIGAFYLYFINSVFISFATFIGVRVLHFHRKEFTDPTRAKRVRNYIVWITIATMAPAVYLTYGIVKETFYNSAANNFINNELRFADTQILNREVDYKNKEISVVLIGKEIPEEQLQLLKEKLASYRLEDTNLKVFQGLNQGDANLSSIRSMMFNDLYQNSEHRIREQQHMIDSLQNLVNGYTQENTIDTKFADEMKVLFPAVASVSMGKTTQLNVDTKGKDTLDFAMVRLKEGEKRIDRAKLQQWLSARIGKPDLQVIYP